MSFFGIFFLASCSKSSDIELSVQHRVEIDELGETMATFYEAFVSQSPKEMMQTETELAQLSKNESSMAQHFEVMTKNLDLTDLEKVKIKNMLSNKSSFISANRELIEESISSYYIKSGKDKNLKGFFRTWNTQASGCGQQVFNAFMDTAIAIGATVVLAPTGWASVWAGLQIASEVSNLYYTALICS